MTINIVFTVKGKNQLVVTVKFYGVEESTASEDQCFNPSNCVCVWVCTVGPLNKVNLKYIP